MLARLDYEKPHPSKSAEVSEQVGMNRHNVNRSIKKLIELGVILEGVKIGISRSTLPTCAHLSPDSQQGYTELALCLVNPKPLK